MSPLAKISLANLPTPLLRYEALDALVGTRVWVKRDDMSAGPEAGNKIRKLEYLLADALARKARTVITCGGVQSNHARATTLLARRLGLQPVLLLRTSDGQAPAEPWQGNLLLDALAGAEIRFITPAQYRDRDALMSTLAAERSARGEPAYVVPEGGSNGLGALGYIDAMGEVRSQLDQGLAEAPERFDAVVHACGSGGTAAGVVLGAARFDVAQEAIAMAVCDDSRYFEERIAGIVNEANGLLASTSPRVPLRVLDHGKGPAYGVPTDEQLAFIAAVARCSGLILDPVYTGKALHALSVLPEKPATVLFLHTGGLPGVLAEAERFRVR